MKKLSLIAISLMLLLSSCTANDVATEQPCECVVDAIRYISFDDGATWAFNSYDGRHGMTFECEFQVDNSWNPEPHFMYRLVIGCRE